MEQTIIKVSQKLDETAITCDSVKELLGYYNEITSKTGNQLNWSYENHALPYDIMDEDKDGQRFLHLQGRDRTEYHHLLISVSTEETEESKTAYIIIHLPSDATHGDKGKANEFAKFLGNKYKGELTLFNGRIMPFA